MYYRQQPPGPPPSYTPKKSSANTPGLKAVDPGAIRFCRYKFTYIWLNNGDRFWAWLLFVGPRSIAGYRWRRGRWRYFGTDIRNIDSFSC